MYRPNDHSPEVEGGVSPLLLPCLSSPCLVLPSPFKQYDFWDSQGLFDYARTPQSLLPPPPGLPGCWNVPTANLGFSPGLQSGLGRWKVLDYPF